MGFRIQAPETAFSLDPSGKAHKRVEDPKHLAFIRTLPCLVSGVYGVEAAHVRYGDPAYNKPMTAKARKPHDWWVVPLSPEAHRAQHSTKERLYWDWWGIDPLAVAQALYRASGDTEEALKIIAKARAGE
ncbi:DUF968 domain-containing protein [Pseudovibrio exalbescens]|uniref:DUF968 domain-containing protein n=1 Tax=Pseudovibrio exalbescens TaxID=197461 RepID=UPI000C9C0757|nr:hypothetical protein [Pseudovibrio exalbescens]